jgi:hypothetical protein
MVKERLGRNPRTDSEELVGVLNPPRLALVATALLYCRRADGRTVSQLRKTGEMGAENRGVFRKFRKTFLLNVPEVV